jgi:hypothetical protein
MCRCKNLGVKLRMVWIVLAAVIAVVLTVVAITQWNQASKFLAVVSTLAAIAAVGVAVWQGRLALAAAKANASRSPLWPSRIPGSRSLREMIRRQTPVSRDLLICPARRQ